MAYKDNLRKASFRGVPFLVSTNDTGGGRRFVVHKYPKRDVQNLEDMGRKEREYAVEGFVIGDDAIQQRNNIVDALEKKGTGLLVHPTFGTQTVGITNYNTRDILREQRIAYFSFTFVEGGENVYPLDETDYLTTITAATTDSLSGSFKSAFTENFSIVGADLLNISALDTLHSAISMVNRVVQAIPSQFAYDSSDLPFADTINSVQNTISTIMSLPGEIADSLFSITTKISEFAPVPGSPITSTNNLAVVNAALELVRFGESSDININPEPGSFGGTLSEVPETTPTRTQERKNQESIVRLIRQTGIAEAMKASMKVSYDSYQQAAETRDLIIEKTDKILEAIGDSDIGDDDSFEALDDLKGKIAKGLIAKGADRPPIETYTVPARIISSLELAYDKYEDYAREQEIIDRNTEITHPGFLPGNVELEVLNA
jgi:prophage DNA circulation protein